MCSDQVFIWTLFLHWKYPYNLLKRKKPKKKRKVIDFNYLPPDQYIDSKFVCKNIVSEEKQIIDPYKHMSDRRTDPFKIRFFIHTLKVLVNAKTIFFLMNRLFFFFLQISVPEKYKEKKLMQTNKH